MSQDSLWRRYIRMFTALVFAALILVCTISVLYPQELFTYGSSHERYKNEFSANSKSPAVHGTKNHFSTRSVAGTTHLKTDTPQAAGNGQQNRTWTNNLITNASESEITYLVTSPKISVSNALNNDHTNLSTPTLAYSKTDVPQNSTPRTNPNQDTHSNNSSEYNCKTQTRQIENELVMTIEKQFDMFKGAMSAMQKERQAILDRACHEKYGVNRSTLHPDYEAFKNDFEKYHPTIYYSDNYEVMVCEVAKAGCTQWKLALLEMENIVTDPYKLEHEIVHATAYGARTMLQKIHNITKIRKVLDTYFGIITVRNPFERLLSAYFDKLAPRKNFTHPKYTPISERIRKKFHKSDTEQKRATFENFIDFLLEENERGTLLDLHWDLFTRACNPCSYHYDYIARLETIEKDARYLEDLLGLNNDTRRKTPIVLFHGAKDSKTKAKTSSIKMVTNFLKVPKEKRLKLYEMYKPDFVAFGYSYPAELLV